MRYRLTISLLALLVFAPGCAFLDQFLGSVLQKPTLTFQKAELRNVNFTGAGTDLTWSVNNPNDFGVNLASIGYDLKIDGKQFTKGQSEKGIKIAPAGSSPVTLPFDVLFKDLGQALLALYQKTEVPYEISGHFGFNSPMGVIKVPYTHAGKLPVPRLPKVQIAGAKLGSLSLSGARLDVQVQVSNDNRFPIPLNGLAYGLSLAGTKVASGNARTEMVPAGQKKTITLPVNLNFANTGRAVMDAIRTKRVKIGLDGNLGAGPVQMPLNLSRDVQL